MLTIDQIKEEFRKKFPNLLVARYEKEVDDVVAQDVTNEVLAHLSAQYEKLIEECLPEDTECNCGCHLPLVTTHLCPNCFDGRCSALSTIRTSLQERGIKIK